MKISQKFLLHYAIPKNLQYNQSLLLILLFLPPYYQFYYYSVNKFQKEMQKQFDIQETVNRNIEKNQFKSFYNHRSLVGWCSMNYPKVIVNPIYATKPEHKERNYDLDHIFQQKQPKDRDKVEFVKPFSRIGEEDNLYQKSSLTLAATKHETKVDIFEKNHKLAEEYSAVKPVGCVLGPNKDQDYDRKIRQIGEVTYKPSFESEEIRHLRKLPNTIITEENLMEIMGPRLEYLDIQNNAAISNDLINKIGYFAPNVKELNLSSTKIEDDIVFELSKSCKSLTSIDISKCPCLTTLGIRRFLENVKDLAKFWSNHNYRSTNDESLEPLRNQRLLASLSLNFCHEVSSATVQLLLENKFTHLSLSSLPNVSNESFNKLITASEQTLVHLDISFNREEVNNSLMAKVGNCCRLEELVLIDCRNLTDESVNLLIFGEKGKGKSPEGFKFLRVLKLSGLSELSDTLHNLLKRCPALESLDVNNLERLTDPFLDHLKNHPRLERVILNFTPNISEGKLNEVREASKRPLLIRNIAKMTDPNDDGLRMPLPLASMKKKKPKKKKK